jgi:hypothetical protein
VGAALREAFGYPSFRLLMAGYFVCGFQVVFIGVHMPSYLKDQGLTPEVATTALALIGLFNVFGTYAAGALGQRLAKRHILAAIYLLRAVAIVLFVLAPLTPWSVYLFSAVMGLLWLSTVPPTNAIVAQIFGVQYMSMLGGFVFLSHQVGSFLGVWLGGKLYDAPAATTSCGGSPWRWACWPRWSTCRCARRPSRRGRAAAGMKPRAPALRLARRGGAGAAGAGRRVRGLPEPAPGGRPGQPGVGLLLSTDARHPAPRPGCALGAAAAARRHGARPGLRQRPPPALAGRAGFRRHRRRPRRRGAGAAAGAGRGRRGRHRGGPWPLAGPPLRRRRGHQLPVAAAAAARRCDALADGGVLIYETFADGQQTIGRPSRPDFLLQPGRTAAACAGLRVVAFEDGFEDAPAALRAAHRGGAPPAGGPPGPRWPPRGPRCLRPPGGPAAKIRLLAQAKIPPHEPIVGSIVALVTPMHEDGRVDYAGLRRLIDWHIAEGTDCIGVVGTTGESPDGVGGGALRDHPRGRRACRRPRAHHGRHRRQQPPARPSS